MRGLYKHREARLRLKWKFGHFEQRIMAVNQAEESSRPLRTDEHELLTWMLENSTGAAKDFLPQLDGMLAAESCKCGCPSIKLVAALTTPAVSGLTERIVCDFCGETDSALPVGILVFQDDGRLSEMEVYPFDDPPAESKQFGLPRIDTMSQFKIVEPDSK